jgi:hypothetical protein
MSTAKYWPLFVALAEIRYADPVYTAWLLESSLSALKRNPASSLSTAILQALFEAKAKRRLPPTKAEIAAAVDEAAELAANARTSAEIAAKSGDAFDLREAISSEVWARDAASKADAMQGFAANPARYDQQGAWSELRDALCKGVVLPSPGDADKIASAKLPKDVDDLPDDFELFVDVASLKAKFTMSRTKRNAGRPPTHDAATYDKLLDELFDLYGGLRKDDQKWNSELKVSEALAVLFKKRHPNEDEAQDTWRKKHVAKYLKRHPEMMGAN